MCPHPRIYPHTCISANLFARTHAHTHTHTHTHTCIYAQTLIHTCVRALKHIRAYKTKNAFKDTTYNAYTHTDTLIR